MIPPAIQAELTRLGLEALEFEPGSTPTAPAAAARIGVSVGQIAKSLLFRAKDGSYHMIVCAGDKRTNSSLLKALVGSKCSMANAEETMRVTGCPPGGVCPYGVTGHLAAQARGDAVDNRPACTIWIDESLSIWDRVYPAAGNDATGVPTSYAQLVELAGNKTCRVTE